MPGTGGHLPRLADGLREGQLNYRIFESITSSMFRTLSLSILLLTAADARVAPAQRNWYPLEQTLTRADVPSPAAGKSAFGSSVALSGASLAVGEASWELEDISDIEGSVHVFQRKRLKLKNGKFWGWKQTFPAGAYRALGQLNPTVPIALESGTLAFRAPGQEGLDIYRPDSAGAWTIRQRFALISSDPVLPTKIVISGNTLAFSTESGAVHTLKRTQADGDWSADLTIPASVATQGADIALGNNLLAITKKDETRPGGSVIEIMEKNGSGQWASAGILDLKLGFGSETGSMSALFAFDEGSLVVFTPQTDTLGNPLGGTLYRYTRGEEAWGSEREVLVNAIGSQLAVGDGVISVHGGVQDLLGNPTSGPQLMMDRNFRVRGNINHNVSSMSLNGGKIATANLIVDFSSDVRLAKVLIHRNPMKGWFKRR